LSTPFGLHPNLPELQSLFGQKKAAIVANVGTLIGPTTQAQYKAGYRPLSLYSHSDQQAQWQSSISNTSAGTGWGGRLADSVASYNAASGFPVITVARWHRALRDRNRLGTAHCARHRIVRAVGLQRAGRGQCATRGAPAAANRAIDEHVRHQRQRSAAARSSCPAPSIRFSAAPARASRRYSAA